MVFCIVLFRFVSFRFVRSFVRSLGTPFLSTSRWSFPLLFPFVASPSLPELIPTVEPGEPVAQHRSRRWASNGTHGRGRAKNCRTRNIIARHRLLSLRPDQPSIIPNCLDAVRSLSLISPGRPLFASPKFSIFILFPRSQYRNYHESSFTFYFIQYFGI